MEIEVVESKDKYSFSLCFDKELTTEYFMFCKETDIVRNLSKMKKDEKNTILFERSFGSILTDCFNFAQSDNFYDIKTAAESLAEVIRQGRGRDDYKPYKEKLFRIYNNSSNPIERAAAFMIWYQFRVKHDEMFATKNALSKKQWKRIGSEYEAYIEKLLAPFEDKISSLGDIIDTECELSVGVAETDSGYVNIYTWQNDLLPVYMIYLPLLEMQKMNILICKECGKQFIAKRIDTQVCSDECKRKRQRGYNQKHIVKVNENPLVISYKEHRQHYLDFENFLKGLNAPKELTRECVQARKEYEQDFEHTFSECKANHLPERAVKKCIKQHTDIWDELRKELMEKAADSGTEVTV